MITGGVTTGGLAGSGGVAVAVLISVPVASGDTEPVTVTITSALPVAGISAFRASRLPEPLAPE